MASDSREFSRELVRLYLEERGYLPAFGLTYQPPGAVAERSPSRADHEIDVVAVRIVGGRAEGAILGVVKGYWTGSSMLSPSRVRDLEKNKKALTRGFSEARENYVRGRFGLGEVPLKKVLFYSLRSPKKARDAESMLRLEGIEVVYLEDIIAEVLPRMAAHPFLASGTTLQTIRALRRSVVFEGRRGEAPREPRPAKRRTKAKRAEDAGGPQLDLFAAPRK